MLAITLVLAAAVVQADADNCGTWSKGTGANALSYERYKFKTTLDNLKCVQGISATSCGQNCCEELDICHKHMAVACDTPADNAKDPAKMGTAATATEAKTTCCSAKETCGSHSCATGYKALTGKTDHKCVMQGTIKCSDSECCEIADKTCSGYRAAGLTCKSETTLADGTKVDTKMYMSDTSKDTTAVTDATAFGTCCKATDTCIGRQTDAMPTKIGADGKCKTDATKEYDPSKHATAVKADLSDYEDQCCTTIAVCKDFTCSAGAGFLGEKGAGVTDTTECLSMMEWGKSPACSAAVCCKLDPDTCAAKQATGSSCESGKYYDTSLATVAAKDNVEFKANCCKDKATCQEAKDYVIPSTAEGQAAGSPRQHEPVVALVLTVIGALTVRM